MPVGLRGSRATVCVLSRALARAEAAVMARCGTSATGFFLAAGGCCGAVLVKKEKSLVSVKVPERRCGVHSPRQTGGGSREEE